MGRVRLTADRLGAGTPTASMVRPLGASHRELWVRVRHTAIVAAWLGVPTARTSCFAYLVNEDREDDARHMRRVFQVGTPGVGSGRTGTRREAALTRSLGPAPACRGTPRRAVNGGSRGSCQLLSICPMLPAQLTADALVAWPSAGRWFECCGCCGRGVAARLRCSLLGRVVVARSGIVRIGRLL